MLETYIAVEPPPSIRITFVQPRFIIAEATSLSVSEREETPVSPPSEVKNTYVPSGFVPNAVQHAFVPETLCSPI